MRVEEPSNEDGFALCRYLDILDYSKIAYFHEKFQNVVFLWGERWKELFFTIIGKTYPLPFVKHYVDLAFNIRTVNGGIKTEGCWQKDGF